MPPADSKEWVWSDAWSTTSSFAFGANSGATGGGVSATFSAPPYQTAAGITGAADSGGTNHAGRGVPDVAAMVGYSGSGSNDWFIANGVTYNFVGTSCATPLMAGLAAVLRSAFGRALGPYNTLLYELRDSAFNDITAGNNDSGDTPANVKSVIPSYTGHTPDAPYFTAGAGWDACTGLGSIDGTKLLNGIASLLYTPNFYLVNKGSFGLDEVNVNSSYSNPPPLWLVLEGYTPDAVTAAHFGADRAGLGRGPDGQRRPGLVRDRDADEHAAAGAVPVQRRLRRVGDHDNRAGGNLPSARQSADADHRRADLLGDHRGPDPVRRDEPRARARR